MNTHARATRLAFLALDLSLIVASFQISDFVVKATPQISDQYLLFFGLFAVVWAVVSGFTHFVVRVDYLLSCSRSVANLLNAMLLHALVLLASVIVFNLSSLPAMPLIYTYLATAALVVLSRMLLFQVLAYFKAAMA